MKARRFLALLMAGILTLAALSVTAFADNIADTAAELESGKKTSVTLSEDGVYKDYKIVLSKAGTLSLSLTSLNREIAVFLYDSDGSGVEAAEVTASKGELNGSTNSPLYLKWNSIVEKFSGKVKFELSEGTYYLRIKRHSTDGTGKVSFTATYPSGEETSKAKISLLTITLDKGDSVKLGAVVEPIGADVKWTSSKKSVAAVSVSGKVTAKAKGSAVITAQSGTSKVKIKIVVE